jgi:hypothetical protein
MSCLFPGRVNDHEIGIADMRTSFRELLDGLPTRARLQHAYYKEGVPKAGQYRGQVEPERLAVVLQHSESGVGWGEFTIVQTPQGVFVDTEHTSLDRVRKQLTTLLESAITDNELDPAKHALYNRVMGRVCGLWCRVCDSGE